MGKSIISKFGIVILILVLGVGYKIFFVDSDEVINFNNTLVELSEKSDEKYKPFNEMFAAYYDEKEIDIKKLSDLRDTLESELSNDLQSIKDLQVPDDELCKDFHKEFVAYHKNSVEIARKYTEVLAYAAKHNPPAEKDVEAVDKILKGPQEIEDLILKNIEELQERMAKKFDLEIQ